MLDPVITVKRMGSHLDDNREKITLTEARKLLGVSPNKMSKLISDGTLTYEQDPLDQRVKLVKRSAVENLKQRSRKS